MLQWFIALVIIAIIAGLFGFGNIASLSWIGAKIIAFIAIVVLVLCLIFVKKH